MATKGLILFLSLIFSSMCYAHEGIDEYCFTNYFGRQVYITAYEKGRPVEKREQVCFYFENTQVSYTTRMFHFSAADYNPRTWIKVMPETYMVREWHKIKVLEPGKYEIIFKNKMMEIK